MKKSDAVEVWFTPSDYAPSYRVRVSGDDIELLFMQDIWPGYPGAKELPIEQRHKDYIQTPEVKAQILKKADFVKNHPYPSRKPA